MLEQPRDFRIEKQNNGRATHRSLLRILINSRASPRFSAPRIVKLGRWPEMMTGAQYLAFVSVEAVLELIRAPLFVGADSAQLTHATHVSAGKSCCPPMYAIEQMDFSNVS